MRRALPVSIALAISASASLAAAQDINTPPINTTPIAPPMATVSGGSITDTSGTTDHSVVVGHMGLRYFGSASLTTLDGSGMPGTSNADVHTVGMRYWFSNMIALDAGLAFGLRTGSTNVSGRDPSSQDLPIFIGFGLHAGLPIALAESKHLAIMAIPYLEFFHGSSSITTGGGHIDNSMGSNIFRIGGNLAAELQFGFIGIPQLSLQAQFGLGLSYGGWSYDSADNRSTNRTSVSESHVNLDTTVGNVSTISWQGTGTGSTPASGNPGERSWSLTDILTGAISITYYFGHTPGAHN